MRIAPLVLGGNVFGWNVDEKTSFALLDAFVDAGFNAIDTADSYSRWARISCGGDDGGKAGVDKRGEDRHRGLGGDIPPNTLPPSTSGAMRKLDWPSWRNSMRAA